MPSESLNGYTSAVLDDLDSGQATVVSEQLPVFVEAFDNDDLRTALTDPSVPAESRRAIVVDLLRDRAAFPTIRLVSFAVTAERASELPGALEWLVRRVRQAARAAGAAGAPETLGARPHEAPAGRSGTHQRLDGYATAVFEVSDRELLEEVEDELFRFARTVEASDPLRGALTDMDLPVTVRTGIVRDLLAPAAKAATVSLATYAVRAGRARDYVGLVDWLVERTAGERNLRVAEVRSAVELEETQRERLGRALGRLTGRDVELRVSVDPTLIGGLVALVGDTIIDGSIRSRLDQLRSGLSAAFSADRQTGDRQTRNGQ